MRRVNCEWRHHPPTSRAPGCRQNRFGHRDLVSALDEPFAEQKHLALLKRGR